MQVKNTILNLLLLVLEISLDLSPDASHKSSGFSKALPEKKLKFVPSRRDGNVIFKLSFVLLPVEVDLIPEEQGREKYALRAHGTNCVKIIFGLLTKAVVFHMGATILQVGVFGLEGLILEGGICFAMFLALKKQF